jgi:uncharacterized membrane protein YbhN (UPF0104 family)
MRTLEGHNRRHAVTPLTIVVVRIASLLLALGSLQYSGVQLLAMLQSQQATKTQSFTVLFTSFSILLCLAALLWFLAPRIAKTLTFDLPSSAEPAHLEYPQLQAIALLSIGLWIAVNALADLAYWLTYSYVSAERTGTPHQYSPDDSARIARDVVCLGFAIPLILGKQGLARMLHAIRGMDSPRARERGE